jgi:protein-S-isoprenylcysteine O-methyltransferase Ste14
MPNEYDNSRQGKAGSMVHMIHPLLCYLGVALSFVLSFALFISGTLDVQKYFYAPVFLLIVFYTVVAMVTDKQNYQKRSFRQVFPKSIGKYVLWGFILAGVILFYQVHPAYKAVTPNTRVFFRHFFYAFAVCGLPYFYLEEKYRYCKENVLADSYIRIALLVRCLLRMDFHLFRRRLFSKKSRGMLLSAILRIHYIPIMIEQVHFGVTTFTQGTQVQNYTLLSIMFMITALAWLIDSNNASIGYFWQSSFTKTRFREIDPHPSHWIVVLACYPPFIYFVNSYLALFPSLPETSQRVFSHAGVNTGIDIVLLTALVLYMLSGSALAFSCSNLSYKTIQTKGPYRLMRHPATTFKLIYFTLAFYRFAPAYTMGWLFFYLVWVSIYIARALVEERFLRRFPDYRAYMKKTRYRFIPGVV